MSILPDAVPAAIRLLLSLAKERMVSSDGYNYFIYLLSLKLQINTFLSPPAEAKSSFSNLSNVLTGLSWPHNYTL